LHLFVAYPIMSCGCPPSMILYYKHMIIHVEEMSNDKMAKG